MQRRRLIRAALAGTAAFALPMHAFAQAKMVWKASDVHPLGYPTVDPHGDPIPDRALRIANPTSRTVADLALGDTAVVARVPDGNAELFRYLAGIALVPGEALLRRPTHSGTASIRIAPRHASLALTANYAGKRPDLDFNLFPSPTVTLPAYTRIDVSGLIDVWTRPNGSSLSLTGRVENALGREYETVLHYPAPGRTLLLGARFSGSL